MLKQTQHKPLFLLCTVQLLGFSVGEIPFPFRVLKVISEAIVICKFVAVVSCYFSVHR